MKQNIVLILVISLFIHQSSQTACTGNTVTSTGASDDGGVTGACNSCPDGYYSSDDTTCVQCAAGYYGAGIKALANSGASLANSCVQCTTGYYSNAGTTSITKCTQCADGYYSADSTTCIQCSAGYKGTGAKTLANGGAALGNSCSQCQAGYSSIAGTPSSGNCNQCADGYYSSDNTNCSKCPVGTIGKGILPLANGGAAQATACANCPTSSSSTPGTPSTSSCSCNDGYYSADSATCIQCPAGYKGIGPMSIANGGASLANACSACTNNLSSLAGTSSTGACNQCADGYYSSDNTTCIACDANYIGKGILPLANGGAAKSIACVACPDGQTSVAGTPSTKSCTSATTPSTTNEILLAFSITLLLFVGF